MKKKVFVISGIAIVVLVAVFLVFKNYTKSHSPSATSTYQGKGAKLEVAYCKPQKKGRVIFGDKNSGALQPYGKYWRIGANEATIFSTDKDLEIGTGSLKAGKYQIYAIPEKDNWQINFNSEWDRWGALEANHSTDVLSISVPAKNDADEKEILMVNFENDLENNSTNLIIHWDRTKVIVPIKVK
jgi:hypothetical protein